jgi:hypothetical protein
MDKISIEKNYLGRVAGLVVAGAAALGAGVALAFAHPAPQAAAKATSSAALQLADKMLLNNASLDDEGRWRLIDPVGPGGVSRLFAKTEVFAPTMIYGQYSGYNAVRDPFAPPEARGDEYNPPMPYGPPRGLP